MTRFAYGISCLQVTKLRLNAKCAILTDIHSEHIRTLDPPSAPLKTGKQEIEWLNWLDFFYTVLCTILFINIKLHLDTSHTMEPIEQNKNIDFFCKWIEQSPNFPRHTTRQSELVLLVWYKIWVRNVIAETCRLMSLCEILSYMSEEIRILMDIER